MVDHQYPLEWRNQGRASTKKIFENEKIKEVTKNIEHDQIVAGFPAIDLIEKIYLTASGGPFLNKKNSHLSYENKINET